MAFTKKQKKEILAQYESWLEDSKAIFFLEYNKLNMPKIDDLRDKAREIGGEFHVTKNTLLELAMKNKGFDNAERFTKTTICGFAFEDAPALAKVVKDCTKEEELFKFKTAYLGEQLMDEAQVKALADLPPLPVMRATLMGTIMASASKLVRTIAEPGRSLAAVINAYSEKSGAPAEA